MHFYEPPSPAWKLVVPNEGRFWLSKKQVQDKCRAPQAQKSVQIRSSTRILYLKNKHNAGLIPIIAVYGHDEFESAVLTMNVPK